MLISACYIFNTDACGTKNVIAWQDCCKISIFVVDSDTPPVLSKGEELVWDDERGIVALRSSMCYVMRQRIQCWSKRIDTPFSLFALQCKFYLINPMSPD